MLLAAMLFVAPAFAEEGDKTVQNTEVPAQNTPATEDKKAEDKAPVAEDKKAEDKTPAAEDKKEEVKAPEAPKAEDKKEEAKTEEKSMFAKVRELAVAPFVFVLATAPDRIAKETLGRLAALECLKGTKVADFLGHKYTGRTAVAVVAAVAAYKVYQVMNPQDETDEDDQMFE